MKLYRHSAYLLAILLIAALCSCGIYTFSESAVGGAKTIAVPGFENRTSEFDLEVLLSDKLTQALLTDNTLKVVPQNQGDLVVTGAIVRYDNVPNTYDESMNVTEYKSVITLDIKVEYPKTEKILWEDKNLSDFGIYSVVDGETQSDGDERALDKLVTEIMNRTVKSW